MAYDYNPGGAGLYLLLIWLLIIVVGSIFIGFVITIVDERRHTSTRRRKSRLSRR